MNEEMIERLRASKAAALAEAYASGEECGSDWAENRAEYRELRRLLRFRYQQKGGWAARFADDDAATWTHGEMLYEVIASDSDRGEAAAFWESLSVSEEEQGDGEFMRGFSDGAIRMFMSVRSKI